MSTVLKPGTAGATRSCPHCRTTILASANVCPGCRGHLRFDSAAAQEGAAVADVPLSVMGTVKQPMTAGASEYTVIVSIRNDEGDEIGRHVVGVGALRAGEERSFSVTVEQVPAKGLKPPPAARSRPR